MAQANDSKAAESIPVLTLWQPWASLVALGVKRVETRSWSTKYRGPLAIHAANRRPEHDLYFPKTAAFGSVLTDVRRGRDPVLQACESFAAWDLPLGAIVATCTLGDVVPVVGHQDAVPERDGFCHVGPGGLWLRGYDANRDVEDQRPYGDFTAGRYAWLLADVVPVDPPVPFRGGQGLSREWTP